MTFTPPSFGEPHDPKGRNQGVLPIRSVRVAAFVIVSASIFACVVICVLAVWEMAASDTGWRAVASLGIISGGAFAFCVVNELFGRSLGAGRPLAAPPGDEPAA